MINKKYLKLKDYAILNDGSVYRLSTKKAIERFHNDDGKVVKIIRPLSTLSPNYIGIKKDEENNVNKIAFWINSEKKYATSNYTKSKKYENKYNIVLWKAK